MYVRVRIHFKIIKNHFPPSTSPTVLVAPKRSSSDSPALFISSCIAVSSCIIVNDAFSKSLPLRSALAFPLIAEQLRIIMLFQKTDMLWYRRLSDIQFSAARVKFIYRHTARNVSILKSSILFPRYISQQFSHTVYVKQKTCLHVLRADICMRWAPVYE